MVYDTFSLIMATYGREKEVDSFLKSITATDYDKNKIQIVIVDQNDKINLENIVKKYSNDLDITHIKSLKRGLALNRNIGLKRANGDIIAFPDDDCEYLPNTLKDVQEFLQKTNVDIIMGRIVERDGRDSLREWPKESINVTKGNFYTKCSSVTMFIKRENGKVVFNENLGAGQYFGSCEDANLIYENLKKGNSLIYKPEVKVYHPHYDSNSNMDLNKIMRYGLGFGAMVKSNFDFHMFILFIKAEIYHLLKSIFYFITLRFNFSKRSWISFTSRIKGFLEYKKDKSEV